MTNSRHSRCLQQSIRTNIASVLLIQHKNKVRKNRSLFFNLSGKIPSSGYSPILIFGKCCRDCFLCTITNMHGLWFFPWHYAQLQPFFASSSTPKQNISQSANVISEGSPSRICRVRRISFGITTRPKSSIRRTIPVAFIINLPCGRRRLSRRMCHNLLAILFFATASIIILLQVKF